MLACGAELKNTFCLAKGRRAWVGHHIGDLANYETLASFRDGIAHFERLFAVAPAVVAHDLHPATCRPATRWSREGVEHVGVQHHHAHLAACLAEHGETGPAVGAIYDGTGYGPDGTVWGGELLVGDLRGFERAGHLHPVRMPGGEQAIREPWRMACAWLVAAPARAPAAARGARRLRGRRRGGSAVARLARGGVASPADDERRPAVRRGRGAVRAAHPRQLRGPGRGRARGASPRRTSEAPIPCPGDPAVLDARETVAAVAQDARPGCRPRWCRPASTTPSHRPRRMRAPQAAEHHSTTTVVLSGGVFQNALLLERTSAALAEKGLRVLVPAAPAAQRRRHLIRPGGRRGKRYLTVIAPFHMG